jgi:hypothetical protein
VKYQTLAHLPVKSRCQALEELVQFAPILMRGATIDEIEEFARRIEELTGDDRLGLDLLVELALALVRQG